MTTLPTRELLSIKRDVELALGKSVISVSSKEVGGEIVVMVLINFSGVSKPLPEYIHDHRVEFENISAAGLN